MGTYLAGAGPDHIVFPEIFDRFAAEVSRARTAGTTRIAVVVHDRAGNPAGRLPEYVEPLRARMPFEPVPVLLGQDGPAHPSVFDGVDAVVVGGGLTPAYWEGLTAAAAAITGLVAGGASYLGFSAGAMVAPVQALVGGYRVKVPKSAARSARKDCMPSTSATACGLPRSLWTSTPHKPEP